MSNPIAIANSLINHQASTGVPLPIALDAIVALELAGYIADLNGGNIFPDPDQKQSPIRIDLASEELTPANVAIRR